MKPETEAKAIIVLIIGLIAFGIGSGAGIVMGLSQNDTLNTTQINATNQNTPQIPTTKNVDIPTEPQTTSNSADTNSESVYVSNGGNSGNDQSQQNSNTTTNQT